MTPEELARENVDRTGISSDQPVLGARVQAAASGAKAAFEGRLV